MKLSDGTIRKLIDKEEVKISPMPLDKQFQPCSVDLLLGTSFVRIDGPRNYPIIATDTTLNPGEFLLASTLEVVTLNSCYVGQVHGKSSWARMGLIVEAAGLVDPGFEGRITLEMFNMGPTRLALRAGEPICQLTLERVDWPVVRPYGHPDLGSHYQGQRKATPGERP